MRDHCRSVAFDEDKNEVIFFLEVTSKDLRPDYSRYETQANNIDTGEREKDLVILRMSSGGQLRGAYNINFDQLGTSLYPAYHSSFVLNSHYVFGAFSNGYKTKYQIKEKDPDGNQFHDSHVFKFSPFEENSCYYMSEIKASDMDSMLTKVTPRNIESVTRDRYLFKEMNNAFLVYSSKYSGAFDLTDSYRFPKMCA